jgi:protein SCO1/2
MILVIALGLIAGAVIGTRIAPRGPAALHGVAADGDRAAPEFTLTDQHGQPFQLSAARGHVVLLVFGYTECPDACPLTLATWARARVRLAADATRVRFVFISVDPPRDSPERIGRYLAQFDQAFIGLTGSSGDIEGTVIAYGAFVRVEQASSDRPEVIAHSEATFLIDAAGRIIEAFPTGASAEDIAADVKTVLGR